MLETTRTPEPYVPDANAPRTLEGEQLAAVRARHATVALSAGAGSGKTTVLVERFLDLVRTDGVSPLGILAITYTERAAAEMKERIVRRFEELGDETNRRLAESAYISTIHGFCARILREHPLAAGVDLRFDVIDDLRLGVFLDEELERLHGDPWFLEMMGRLPTRFDASRPRLFELICDCVFDAREFGKGVAAESVFDVDEHVAAAMHRVDAHCAAEWARACALLATVADEIRGLTVSGPASTAQHAQLCALLGSLGAQTSLDAAVARAFCACTGFTRGVKDKEAVARVKSGMDPARAILKLLADFDRAAQERIEQDSIAPLKVGIYRRADDLRTRYTKFKADRALLDFEDLQRHALRLLERADVRSEYASRFQHVLLDEAQDTNEVQKALVDRIVHGADRQRGLFAVGDVKQAIYGFRGANVALFHDLHRAAGDGRLSLRDNYRSRAEILATVNAVGEALWSDASLDFEALVPKFAYEAPNGATPHVELLLVSKPEEERGSALAREREAAAIAQRIRRMVEGDDHTPPLRVYDREAKRYRGARYGDVAVLVSRRTHFAVYERACWALDVPVVADGGRGFFAAREVQDVLDALRVVANPLDDLALVATLRSPLFGWSDADLVRLRLAAGKRALWSALRADFAPAGEGADAHARAVIESLRRLSSSLEPAALVSALLHHTAYEAALLRTPRGRAAVANLSKLVEFARAFAEADGPSLHAFLRRAELAEAHLSREPDAPVASAGDDVVQLGTIHGAKGLEWPVVVLAGLDADFAKSDGGSVYLAAEETLLVEPKDEDDETVKPASHQPLRAAQKRRDEAEARRLFYVALTRAREYLLMSGVAPAKAANESSFNAPVAWLVDQLGVALPGDGSEDLALGDARVRVTHVVGEQDATTTPTVDERASEARAHVANRTPVTWPELMGDAHAAIAPIVDALVARAPFEAPREATIAQTTVTQLVYFFRCPMVYYLDLVLQVEEHPRSRRRAASGERRLTAVELGSKVHELLEIADLEAESSTEAARLTAASDVPVAERPRVERMLQTVLGDPLLDRARGARRLEREYQFYLGVSGTIVQGVIDLVFEDEHGRGVVVDYKSNDLAAPDRVNVLTEYYKPQIELYALAASKAGLVTPDEATLYFLNKGIARTQPTDARRLAVVEEETADALSRISRGAWDTEPGQKCRRCGYRMRGFCEVGKRWSE